jgi:FlaA1/EpsC-like NDP-sugar epimerase
MSFQKRLYGLVFIDICIVLFSIYTSYWFRFDGMIPDRYMNQFLIYTFISVISCVACMYFFDLYNRIWQYATIHEMIALLKAVILSCSLAYVLVYIIVGSLIPVSIFFRTFETILLLLGGARFAWRVYRDYYYRKPANSRRALIIGAGDCGTSIVKQMVTSRDTKVIPIAFIDDDPFKQKIKINGLPVIGNRSQILLAIDSYKIDDVIIAMPSASKSTITEIISICKQTSVKVRMIPRLKDLIRGKVYENQIRDVDVEDLLGRDSVRVNLEEIAQYVTDKVVMVTGAGGSIGSELCRQIAMFQPKQLLLLGHGENSIYTIQHELIRLFPDTKIVPVIADIKDKSRIEGVFQTFKPHLVFHAAAHKHVPLMEENPSEAIQNNVFGTKIVAETADKFHCERFVLISTDKAVNPTSVMGTTKRIAEMIIQSLNTRSKTKFVAVRFGNVLGSRGSVIPKFKEQISLGGPITVTHPDMIRYFMTIPEASQLVIQAGALARGGEIFVLDMGEPVKILQLAEDLVRLSGFEPYDEIDIQFTGIRPGEKLYEELHLSEEEVSVTAHNRIFVGKPITIQSQELEFSIRKLEKVINQDQDSMIQLLSKIVPTYKKQSVQNK